MARVDDSPPRAQEAESISETDGDLVERQRLRPRRGQLDREWKPVELPADTARGLQMLRRRAKTARTAVARSRKRRTAGAASISSGEAFSAGVDNGSTSNETSP